MMLTRPTLRVSPPARSRTPAREAQRIGGWFLLPVEIEVQRADVRDSANSNIHAWQSQNGDIKDLLSVWGSQPNGRDWMKLRIKFGGLDASQLPPGFVKWDVQGSPITIPDNTLETPEIRWPGDFGVKKIEITIGSLRKWIWVDLPNPGEFNEDEIGYLALTDPFGLIALPRAWLYADTAEDWSKSKTGYSKAEKNALKHSGWMSLCASSLLVGNYWGWLAGLSHERTGYERGSAATGSTMDLHNNAEGLKVVELLANFTNGIEERLLEKLDTGELWIWESPTLDEHAGFDATLKSNNEHINPSGP
jgi:hypothetical protein